MTDTETATETPSEHFQATYESIVGAGGDEPETDEPAPDDEPLEDEDEDEDEDDGADDQAAAEARPWSPQTPKEIDKANTQLEGEAKRHDKRLRDILGADRDGLVPCEVCEPIMQGFRWPLEQLPDDDPRRPLYELLSGPTVALPKQPEFLVACTACNATGMWRTGSNHHDDLMRFVPCEVCGAKGYQDTRQRDPAPIAAPVAAAVAAAAQTETPAEQTADFMNRPPGHMNYGKLPQYLTDYEREIDARDGYSI